MKSSEEQNDFLYNLKMKKIPNSKQINGIRINNHIEINQMDDSRRSIFINQLNHQYDVEMAKKYPLNTLRIQMEKLEEERKEKKEELQEQEKEKEKEEKEKEKEKEEKEKEKRDKEQEKEKRDKEQEKEKEKRDKEQEKEKEEKEKEKRDKEKEREKEREKE